MATGIVCELKIDFLALNLLGEKLIVVSLRSNLRDLPKNFCYFYFASFSNYYFFSIISHFLLEVNEALSDSKIGS